MNIAIDGNEANIGERVGIGEFAYQVIRQLYNYRDKYQYTIFLKDSPREDLPKSANNWRYQIIGPKPLWTQFALPFKLYTAKQQDIIFSPSHYAPRFSPIPCVISVMDLSFIRYPKLFTRKDQIQLSHWTKYSISKAKSVVTISQFTKNQIVDYYKIEPNKIFVTYPGFDAKIYHNNYVDEEIAKIKEKYGLQKYLIFVGTIQPRKNIQRLILAFQKISKTFSDLQLVIIGRKGWMWEETLEMMKNPLWSKKLIYPGYLPNIDVAKLYHGAECFVLPSLYEGFGLPVIEAMACGCPVVISNVSSLPEIAGNSAVYIQPDSIDSIVQGIVNVIRKDQAYFKADLIKRGFSQVKKYSWEKCGSQILEVLEQAVVK